MIVTLLVILGLAQSNTPGFRFDWWLSNDGTIATASNGGGISVFKTKPFKHIANYIFIQDISYGKGGYGGVDEVRMAKESEMTATRWYGEGTFLAAEPNAKDKWAILLRPDSHADFRALIVGCIKPGTTAVIGRGIWLKNVSAPTAGCFAKDGNSIRFTSWSAKSQGNHRVDQKAIDCRTGRMTTVWSHRLPGRAEEWQKLQRSPLIAIGRNRVVYRESLHNPQRWTIWSPTGKSFRVTAPDAGESPRGYVTDRLVLINARPMGVVHVLDLKTRKWSKWVKQSVVGVSGNGSWALLIAGNPWQYQLKRLK